VTRLLFTVYGAPVAQQRHRERNFIVQTPKGLRACSQKYDPKESRSWKQDVKAQVLEQLGASLPGYVPVALHDGPVVLDLFFYLPRPKSLPKRVRHHVKKPDRDNLEKGVKDALKGILWRDDSQVVDGRTRKMYGDPPRVVVAVRLISHDAELNGLGPGDAA
jgi:Holliday junction resolvase RusA-like endonuclease